MSVTTSARINYSDLQSALVALQAGASYKSDGADLPSSGEKTITAVGATDDQLQQAITTASGRFVDNETLRAGARTNLSVLLTEKQQFVAQLQHDLAIITNAGGWHAVSSADADAIMSRILNGFGTVLQAISDHVTITGAT